MTQNYSPHWKKWAPLPDLSLQYDLISLKQDGDSLSLLLLEERQESHSINLHFKSFFFFQTTEEMFLISDLHNMYPESLGKWCFFQSDTHPYLKNIDHQGLVVNSLKKLISYAFIGECWNVHILSKAPPISTKIIHS